MYLVGANDVPCVYWYVVAYVGYCACRGGNLFQCYGLHFRRRAVMPVYEYSCCDKMQIVVRSMDEKEKAPKCETCKRVMKRQFGVAAVTFKGNGWGKDA
jgi:putative FmdB family regulatory protein